MNLDKDFTETYILGVRLMNNGCFESAYNCIETLKLDKKSFPSYKIILDSYISHLEGSLKTINTPIVSDIKPLSIEQIIKQWEIK